MFNDWWSNGNLARNPDERHRQSAPEVAPMVQHGLELDKRLEVAWACIPFALLLVMRFGNLREVKELIQEVVASIRPGSAKEFIIEVQFPADAA